MRVRKLDSNWDLVFGSSQQDFLVNSPDAVAQAVKQRILLFTNEWWENQNAGIPMFTEILGKPGSGTNIQNIDLIINNCILQTQGVSGISIQYSTFNSNTRKYTYQCTVDTIYGKTSISVTV
jgi:hypothetical protein